MPGNRKLWTLTYRWIAEQAGVSLAHARNSAWRKEFDSRDIDSVIQWVNGRRQSRGLPLIGAPPGNSPENFQEISESQAPEAPTGGQATKNPRENKPETPETDSQKLSVHQPYLAPPQPYNPLTGDYSP